MYGLRECLQTSVVGHFKSDYRHGCAHMDFVIVCKPTWWGTSSRIRDTAGYMAGAANNNDTTKTLIRKNKSPD